MFFVGDLTDRGSPLEAALTRRVVRTGKPFVFVPGNHDSDSLARELARDGAVVLTRTGRLSADGETTSGHPVVKVAGLRVAGYDDPFERRSDEQVRRPLRPHAGRVGDRALHDLDAQRPRPGRRRDGPQPRAAHRRARRARRRAARRPLTILTGHTHHAELTRRPGATVINAGTVGAGGTGNLLEREKIGIARLSYETKPSFEALAVDMVTIDPRSGSATARRERLDEAPEPGRLSQRRAIVTRNSLSMCSVPSVARLSSS